MEVRANSIETKTLDENKPFIITTVKKVNLTEKKIHDRIFERQKS